MDRIVVVGGGPAATHLLAALALDERRNPGSLTILDPRQPSAGGSAHSDPSTAFRVNMRTPLHDIPGFPGFEEFLSGVGARWEPPLRSDLGRYTAFVGQLAETRLRERGWTIRRVAALATAAEPATGGGYLIHDGGGGRFAANRVVLATGHEPPSVPDSLAGRACSLYTGDGRFADGIGPSDHVTVVGTGPGAIDSARYLLEDRGHLGPIRLVSRQGMLSAVQTAAGASAWLLDEVGGLVNELQRRPGPVTLETLAQRFGAVMRREDPGFRFEDVTRPPGNALAQLRRDIEDARRGGPAWRQVLEAVGASAPRLWRLLGDDEKARLMRHPLWLRLYYVKRHAMPMVTAEWLLARLEEGRIRVAVSDGRDVPAGDRVVVATGPEYRVTRSVNPLIRQMLAAGLVRPYTAGDGFEIGGIRTQELQAEDAPGIWVMGGLARGEDFAVHSYPALARHARTITGQWL